MNEYKLLMVGLDDDENIKTTYYSCCMDQLLETGNSMTNRNLW